VHPVHRQKHGIPLPTSHGPRHQSSHTRLQRLGYNLCKALYYRSTRQDARARCASSLEQVYLYMWGESQHHKVVSIQFAHSPRNLGARCEIDDHDQVTHLASYLSLSRYDRRKSRHGGIWRARSDQIDIGARRLETTRGHQVGACNYYCRSGHAPILPTSHCSDRVARP